MKGEPQADGRWLYDNLIKPAKIKSEARVILETDGELARLNLETLPVYGHNKHYWLEEVTLSITPSLSILEARKPVETKKSALVIGDPEMVNPDFVTIAKGYHIKAQKVTKREDLAGAVQEMMASKDAYFLEVSVEKEGNVFPMIPTGASVSDIRLS